MGLTKAGLRSIHIRNFKHKSLHVATLGLYTYKSLYGWGGQGCKMYVLNQSALPIIHGINGDKQRGGWEDRDLENDWDSSVPACVCGNVTITSIL